MTRGCRPNALETRGVSRRIRGDWVFPRPHQQAESVDQDHEQLQTQATPSQCFRTVLGYLGNRLTCALAPPIPNEFTPTRSARSAGHGVALTGTFNFPCSQGTLNKSQLSKLQSGATIDLLEGFGFLKLMLGGIVLCSSAKTILMTLDIPEAPSEWPRLGLT